MSNSSSDTGSKASNSCPYTLWEPVNNGDGTYSYYMASPVDESEYYNIYLPGLKAMGDIVRIQSTVENKYIFSETERTFIGTYAEGKVDHVTYGWMTEDEYKAYNAKQWSYNCPLHN